MKTENKTLRCITRTSKSVRQGLILIKGLSLIYLSNWRETSRKRLSLSLENGLQVFFNLSNCLHSGSSLWPDLPCFTSRHLPTVTELKACSHPAHSGLDHSVQATYGQCSGSNQSLFLHVISLLHLSITRPYPAYTL